MFRSVFRESEVMTTTRLVTSAPHNIAAVFMSLCVNVRLFTNTDAVSCVYVFTAYRSEDIKEFNLTNSFTLEIDQFSTLSLADLLDKHAVHVWCLRP